MTWNAQTRANFEAALGHPLAAPQIAAADALVSALAEAFGDRVPAFDVGLREDAPAPGAFYFAWSRDGFYLEVQFNADGQCDWLLSQGLAPDREVLGTDGQSAPLPTDKIVSILRGLHATE